jgi:hypothetical protein
VFYEQGEYNQESNIFLLHVLLVLGKGEISSHILSTHELLVYMASLNASNVVYEKLQQVFCLGVQQSQH